jgi:uncharacterized protein DUF5985
VIPEYIYLLCSATSVLCAWLLLSSYSESRNSILLWTGLCFVGLALNNVILFIDLAMIPDLDLYFSRNLPGLAGMGILIYGLIWEST